MFRRKKDNEDDMRPLAPEAPQIAADPRSVARPNPPDLPLAEYSTTRTIRSQCNLRRDSIQLVPVPGQPYEYDVSFLFDCGADTSVSIHFLACDRMQVFNTLPCGAIFVAALRRIA